MSENATDVTRKRFRRFVDVGKRTAEKVVVVSTDGAFNESRVDFLLSRRIGSRRKRAINEVRLDLVDAGVLQKLLHVARTLRRSSLLKQRVIRA